VTRDVALVDGPGPPVVLLHEISGVSLTCLAYAEELAKDFRVHVPVLHGYPGQVIDHMPTQPKDPVRKLRLFCVRREFTLLAAGVPSPVTSWLRALCRHVGGAEPGTVGVVGMCLTGGFVFSLVLDPVVGAAVASQPSLPMRRGADRVGADELGDGAEAVARCAATGTPVLGLRFVGDPMSPAARFDRLEQVYADNYGLFLRESPAPPSQDIPGPSDSHSVLTDHSERAPGVRDRVRAFLLEHLGAA
jgi:dienelactone hydrolase